MAFSDRLDELGGNIFWNRGVGRGGWGVEGGAIRPVHCTPDVAHLLPVSGCQLPFVCYKKKSEKRENFEKKEPPVNRKEH